MMFPLLIHAITHTSNLYVIFFCQITNRTGITELCSCSLLNFVRNFQNASKVTIPLHFPTSSVWGFQFLHILTNTCFYLTFFLIAIFVYMKWYLTVSLWFWFVFPCWTMVPNIFFVCYWLFAILFGDMFT